MADEIDPVLAAQMLRQGMYSNPAEAARVRNQQAHPGGMEGPTFDAADKRTFGQRLGDALVGLGSQQTWMDYKQPPVQTVMANLLNTVMPMGIVSPKTAAGLNTSRALPDSELFRSAVENTPGAAITDAGLAMRVQRNQLPEQALQDSVRGGVFYLPEGAAQAKHYSTGRAGYGGPERIAGETLVNNPLFVKGATGGKAPELAFDSLVGKGAYETMRSDALKAISGWNVSPAEKIALAEQFLEKHAPEMKDMAAEIVARSKSGNQLPYALQEAAVASAARKAGHDAVLGYSVARKTGQPFLSELFDVREMNYPDKFGTPTDIWETFKGK